MSSTSNELTRYSDEQLAAIHQAMLDDLGIGRVNDLPLENGEKKPRDRDYESPRAPHATVIKPVLRTATGPLGAWQSHQFEDVCEHDRLLSESSSLGDGNLHRHRIQGAAAALRGGRGGRGNHAPTRTGSTVVAGRMTPQVARQEQVGTLPNSRGRRGAQSVFRGRGRGQIGQLRGGHRGGRQAESFILRASALTRLRSHSDAQHGFGTAAKSSTTRSAVTPPQPTGHTLADSATFLAAAGIPRRASIQTASSSVMPEAEIKTATATPTDQLIDTSITEDVPIQSSHTDVLIDVFVTEEVTRSLIANLENIRDNVPLSMQIDQFLAKDHISGITRAKAAQAILENFLMTETADFPCSPMGSQQLLYAKMSEALTDMAAKDDATRGQFPGLDDAFEHRVILADRLQDEDVSAMSSQVRLLSESLIEFDDTTAVVPQLSIASEELSPLRDSSQEHLASFLPTPAMSLHVLKCQGLADSLYALPSALPATTDPRNKNTYATQRSTSGSPLRIAEKKVGLGGSVYVKQDSGTINFENTKSFAGKRSAEMPSSEQNGQERPAGHELSATMSTLGSEKGSFREQLTSETRAHDAITTTCAPCKYLIDDLLSLRSTATKSKVHMPATWLKATKGHCKPHRSFKRAARPDIKSDNEYHWSDSASSVASTGSFYSAKARQSPARSIRMGVDRTDGFFKAHRTTKSNVSATLSFTMGDENAVTRISELAVDAARNSLLQRQTSQRPTKDPLRGGLAASMYAAGIRPAHEVKPIRQQPTVLQTFKVFDTETGEYVLMQGIPVAVPDINRPGAA